MSSFSDDDDVEMTNSVAKEDSFTMRDKIEFGLGFDRRLLSKITINLIDQAEGGGPASCTCTYR